MKPRLLLVLPVLFSLVALTLRAADAPAPLPVEAKPFATTVKKSAIALDNGSIALPKGTRVEVVGKEGDYLLVKFRSIRGKMLLADTDFDPATPVKEIARMPLPVDAKQSTGQTGGPPTTGRATPPALSTNPLDQQPTTNYGKMVQKAKTAEQAHKDKLVEPTNDVPDVKPKK